MFRSSHTKFARSLTCASIFAALFLFAGRATGQTNDVWSNTVSGLWSTSSNWVSGTPTAAVAATYSLNPTSASAIVTVDVSSAVGAISEVAARTKNIALENVLGSSIVVTVNGLTFGSTPNVIINNQAPYNSTPVVCSLTNNTSGSLGLFLGTSGGSTIVAGGNGNASSHEGNHVFIGSNIAGAGPITFLGGGTNDLTFNTAGFNGGLLELAGTNSFTGGITVGDANFNDVPDWGNSGILQIDNSGALPSTGTYTVTINNNSNLFISGTAAINLSNANATYLINGLGSAWNSGAIRVKDPSFPITIAGNVVLGSDAVITTASAGTFCTFQGPITGAHVLQFAGSATASLTATSNNWGSTQIGNGTVIVGAGGSFSTGALNFVQTSTNVPILTFNQPTQTINGLFGSITGTAGSNTFNLNGTRLTINQTVNGSYGSTSIALLSTITGTGSIVKTGTASLTLVNSCSLSGGLKISQGTMLFTPTSLSSSTFSMPAPDTLDGGSIGTTGIQASSTVSLNVLTVTNNSSIILDGTNIHRIIFANSSASVWTSGRMLTINGWTGSYTGGTSGTKGQIFFGTSAAGLTAAQLAQIQFFDGTSNHPAVLLNTGELVPSPSVTTTAASFGPFCNGTANNISVAYTTTGTLTGTYSLQLSDATGSFTATPTVIGSGASPITGTIPAAMAAGTHYRVRVVNNTPAVNGTDNGSDITINASPIPYTVAGSGSICPGATGIDMTLSNSQTGVNYQLYDGATTEGSVHSGSTGSSINFGNQTAGGTYTVLATDGTTACTTAMSGSGSVSINSLPGISIAGTTLITPGSSAALTLNDTSSVDGDIVSLTDGVATYTVTISHGSATFNTPTLSSTTTYSVTGAVSTAGCSVVVTGQHATVYVSATPTAIIEGGMTICPGGATSVDLTITGTASGVVTYTDGVSTYSVTLSSGSGGVGTADVFFSPTSTTTYTLVNIVSSGTYALSGSTTITISALPTVYNVTGTGGYCNGGAGLAVGLDGSDNAATTYQLYDGATPVGSPVAGIGGGAISFGTFTTATTYTVQATNGIGCTNNMAGGATVSINPLPIAYNVTGTGSYCAGGTGVAVGLDNSQTGVTYTLYNGASAVSSPMSGTTGSSISFGSYTAAATYTVLATSAFSCTSAMTGNAVITINPQPVAGTITGASQLSVSGSSTLADASAVGTSEMWISSSTLVATIGSASGIVTGAAVGTSTISYAVTNGCGTVYATKVITVNAVTTGEVVMSQVYGGGGRTGSTYNTEFVELFNPSSSPITMTNWSIQYVAAAGGTWGVNTFSGTIAAHSYFLVAMANGATGSSIPTPDAAPASPSNLNNINGTVALVANSTAITSSAGDVTSSMATQHIVDFVGYGTAISYLTSGAAATSVSSALFRGLNGCVNAGNNSTDFSLATPSPRNSASGTNICPVPTDYYSKATGNLDVTTTWGTNTDGTGTNPPSFTTILQTLHVANGNPGAFSGSNWTVSGTGSVVNVDAGTDFTIPATTTVNATVNVGSGRTLTVANTTLPTFGGVAATSTIVYSGLTGFNLPTSFVYGNLTLANTPVSSTVGSTLSLNGNLTLTGSSILNISSTALVATGTADQTISGNGTTLSLSAFTDQKSAGKVTLAAGTNLNLNAGTLLMVLSGGASNQFSDGGNTITTGNNVDLSGTAASYNFTGTIVLNGNTTGSQNIRGGTGAKCVATLHNLVIAGTLQVKLNPTGLSSQALTGDLIFTAGATGHLNFEGDTLKVGGNVNDSSTTDLLTMTTAGSTLMFNGSSAQTYYSAVSGGNSVLNLSMNNAAGLTLYNPLTATGKLILTNGNITTGSNTLTLSSTGTVSGGSASSYVNGNYVKNIPAGGLTTLAFEVGDVTYSPIKLTFGSAITAGGIEVSSTNGAHPQIASSYINTADYVNRYWTITDQGTTASGTTVNVALSYNSGDETGSGNAAYSMRQYAGSWTTMPSVTNSTSSTTPLLANSTSSTGVIGSSYSGDYVAGTPDCTGAAGGTANASVTTICGSGTSSLSLSGSSSGPGISYQWQSSADGVSYSPISGATSSTYATPTISSTTYYNCVVGCGFTGTTSASTAVTVNANPVPTVGSTGGGVAVCFGTTVTLSGTGASSYSWTGGVTDGSPFTPTAGTHSYTVTGSTGGCSNTATTTITVNALPTVGSTGGGVAICNGAMATLSGTGASSYSWAGAAITDGVPFTPSLGVNIYTVTGTTNGCSSSATTTITVNAIPTVGTTGGGIAICHGTTATLSGTGATTYSWTGGISNGVAFTPAAGVYNYTVTGTTSGCSNTATTSLTVNMTDPGTISGPFTVAVGANITLTDATGSGTWSASNGNATVSGGVVHGVANGVVTISYTVTGGCGAASATQVVAVGTGTVSIPAISGTKFYVCTGATTSFFDATTGGVWSISPSGVASVSATGVVTGITAGTATLSYTIGISSATAVVTVYSSPAAISGIASVCQSGTTTLSDATPGGVWSSGIASTASVGTSGLVTGTNTGVAPIYYTLVAPAGCRAVLNVTVNPNPGAISGPIKVCTGSSISLTDATAGGTWSSLSGTVTVGGSGLVTGSTAGSAAITYAVNGCSKVYNITVNTSPVSVSGITTICQGGVTTLTDATTGGTSWASGNTANATVTATGVVTGVSAGTAGITYSLTTGCTASTVVTVIPAVAAITNNSPICLPGSVTLSDATISGTWTSSNPAIGSVDPISGTVTGVASGSTTISYATSGAGCLATTVVTVNAGGSAGTISGSGTVCVGSANALSNAVVGGIWSSTNTAAGTISTYGVVTGLAQGTTTISYTIINSCGTIAATTVVTVNPLPVAGTITGSTPVCAGSSIALTDATPGGVWSSSNGNATVDGSGNVAGVVGGFSTISYSVTNACGSARATTVVTINALSAGTIGGASSVTAGLSITLTDAVAGGIWSASNSNATVVAATGVVTGALAGTVTISYTVTNGCGSITATDVITVNASGIGGLSGTAAVCVLSTTSLSDATPGGTWHSSNSFVASVGTSGIVTGVAAGTASISYTVGGVPTSVIVTVNPAPNGISGATSVCDGASITLNDITTGGAWTSTAGVSVTTGSTTTTLTTNSLGTSTVTYSLPTGCYKTMNVTVKALPTDILGTLSVCGVGGVTFLSDATAGTSWTISPVGTATVSGSGRVYGVSAGTATVSYTGTNTCITTAIVTVNTLVSLPAISGATNVSHSATITLSDATSGGVWSSSNPALGSVDATGDVTGVGASGTVTITYALAYGSGCTATATKPITVHTPAPPAHGTTVGGMVGVSVGAAVNLDDETVNGSWSSSNTDVATVDGGLITGIAPGNANITHTVTNSNGDVSTSVTPVVVSAIPMDVRIVPNPNNGTFTVKGIMGTMQDAEVTLEVTDVLGQIIYSSKVTAQAGKISEVISLNNTLTNGMYMMNVHSATEQKVFHFVIAK